jgi:hypothetical protein
MSCCTAATHVSINEDGSKSSVEDGAVPMSPSEFEFTCDVALRPTSARSTGATPPQPNTESDGFESDVQTAAAFKRRVRSTGTTAKLVSRKRLRKVLSRKSTDSLSQPVTRNFHRVAGKFAVKSSLQIGLDSGPITLEEHASQFDLLRASHVLNSYYVLNQFKTNSTSITCLQLRTAHVCIRVTVCASVLVCMPNPCSPFLDILAQSSGPRP